MPNTIEVIQKAAPASNSTQIGVQYIGMTPEQASRQSIELFMENFPKLQEIAKKTAEERATEMCNEILKKMEKREIRDFTPFGNPDIQYIIYKAQKNYARFGEKEIMNVLTDLIVERIQSENTGHFKKVIDNAVVVASELSANQLDCLSVLFILTRVRFLNLKNIEDLKRVFDEIDTIFNLENLAYEQEISFLIFKGCLQIMLPNIAKIQSEQYDLNHSEVTEIMPKSIKQFDGDYGLSEIGIILAISNANQKSQYNFDPHVWIHD